ncbi:ras-associated and pleckstrin homology domains-containing 1-like isoform X1 [Brachionus plicatilis]|uniref:Ras-associated and pleckstrin homology domains-containing 1-like isoform X1 n=1 Tax=Brachionus plicatilis TaxID=10195 RepID=A0A3M7SUF7_BRAPC|nr:ras-associated and pleckstrin homology domains-containing 1-like isoform X1 [Brachionus plicatilis]
MYNIQNSQLNEIDSILSELNQLQTELNLPEENCAKMPQLAQNFYFNGDLNQQMDENIEAIDQQFDEVLKFLAQTIDDNDSTNISSSSPSSVSLSATPNSDSNSEPKVDSNDKGKRNSCDSAFIETVSMPSSASFSGLNQNQQGSSSSSCAISELSSQEVSCKQTEAQKAELIRIALEKLKEANIKKLIVKAYTDDGCAKSVIIDETMKVYDVLLMLFAKNHIKPSVNYCIVEYMPKFNMERIFEDHENLVEAMTNWSRDSDNQIFFTERSDKYDLFLKPEVYLTNDGNVKHLDENNRKNLLIEFFQNIGSPVPELEGPLYIKTESKKSWKKYFCVLRQSGLYFIPKGKSKKDMQCLFNFDKLDLYYGLEWKKELKAPTDSCFALKYPQVQKKSSKFIKYICCENGQDMKRWMNGIRIAKYGKQLFANYKKILELIEIYKTTGRLPAIVNRRYSTSQRPNSTSYSVERHNPEDPKKITNQNSTQKSPFVQKDSRTNENSGKKISDSQPSINSSRLSPKQPNLAYTEQLKTLIQSNQMKKNSSGNQSGVNGRSWQNILGPISVTTNLNNPSMFAKSSNCLTSSPNQYSKSVKIPVTTDLTKQLNNKIAESETNLNLYKNSKFPQRNFEFEAEISKNLCHMKTNSASLNFYDSANITENIYEMPTSANKAHNSAQFIQQQSDMFQTKNAQLTCVNIVQNNVIDRNSRGMTPQNAPKALKRYNSTNESEFSSGPKIELTRKKSVDSVTRGSNQTLFAENELGAILARQKKKIEDCENERPNSSGTKKVPSPPITKKPPPPPRNERYNLTRKLSIDNGKFNNMQL